MRDGEVVDMDIDLNTSVCPMNVSLNRSGLVRMVFDEKPADATTTNFPRPEIRNRRVLKIKVMCARVAVGVQIFICHQKNR